MSLFNPNLASCGPSSLVLKLSSHATANHAGLLNIAHPRKSINQPFSQNHLTSVNPVLENDFSRFVHGADVSAAMPRAPLQMAPDWVGDFSRMELESPSNYTHKQHALPHSSVTSQPQARPAFGATFGRSAFGGLGHGLGQGLGQGLGHNYAPAFHNRTEHQQIHHGHNGPCQEECKMDEDAFFAQAFEAVDRELAEKATESAVPMHRDNDKLLEIAGSIVSTMESMAAKSQDLAVSEKLQQSDFLKLMHQIQNKEVGLLEGGEAFVDTKTGARLNEEVTVDVPGPTEVARSETEATEKSQTRQPLGDPLAYVHGSEIHDSEQARKLIQQRIYERKGGEIPPTTVDEIFMDYMHDDDI